MRRYTVRVECPCYADMQVEASSKKEAREIAINKYQCSGGDAEAFECREGWDYD